MAAPHSRTFRWRATSKRRSAVQAGRLSSCTTSEAPTTRCSRTPANTRISSEECRSFFGPFLRSSVSADQNSPSRLQRHLNGLKGVAWREVLERIFGKRFVPEPIRPSYAFPFTDFEDVHDPRVAVQAFDE